MGGVGEDLAAAGIADSSVDAVVMTLVLCTVDDQIKTLSEVKRVLKPGGKFYYMEHIIAQEVIEAFLDSVFLLKLHRSRVRLFVTCNKDLCLEVYGLSWLTVVVLTGPLTR